MNYSADSGYPDVTVAVSGGMRRNYKRYSDVLYFDFFEDQIKSYC
jgi:hypothetical protein